MVEGAAAPVLSVPSPARSVGSWTAKRLALVAIASIYLVGVLVAPIGAIVVRAAAEGAGALLEPLARPDALRALGLSVVLALISIVANGVFGVVGALVLVRQRFLGRGLLDALVDMPLVLSPVMVGLSFLLLFGRQGWFAPILETLSWKVAFAFPGLVLATVFVTLPYTIREVAHVLRELGTGEEEAAATLGASPWTTFLRVTLPNIRHGLAYGVTVTGARALGEFGAVLVLGGAISNRTDTATTFIYAATEERQAAAAYGMALVLVAASVGLLALLERLRARRRREV